MNNPFNQINIQSKQQSESLLNESERNNTILTDVSNYSVFDKSFQQATTFDSGKCIPVLLQECYPGDIYDIDVNAIVRLSAPSSTPLMNINWDLNFFFVPFVQIDPEFKQLMGENNDYGYSNINIQFPFLQFNSELTYYENDLANYFNIPIHQSFNGDKIQIYPFLSYGKVWNEWYRDQNLQSSIDITTCFNESRTLKSSDLSSFDTFYTQLIFGKNLAPCSKFPSYFTTCLPYQQKGQSISLGLFDPSSLTINSIPVKNGTDTNNVFWLKPYDFNTKKEILFGSNLTPSGGLMYYDPASQSNNSTSPFGLSLATVKQSNVISGPTSSINISDLRYAIVSQHLLENWALCGSRYVEQLKSIWGIEIDPKNINRTELIGGINESLIFNNVQQTSQTSSTSQLGRLGSNLFNSVDCPHISYAASQHGYIIGILTTRTAINNGGQGLPKLFSYTDFLDFFNPIFNGISEQPILNKEIYYSGNELIDNKTFGFNEPFLNTKYNIDNANGFLSLNSSNSLFSQFLFGEKYTSTPSLSDQWIRFNPNIIGNTLFNVNGSNVEFYHQFLAIFTFNIKYTTRQPLFNSPRVYGI